MTCPEKCIARNTPEIICNLKHSPSKEPKFHHKEIFIGAGISIKAEFKILINGLLLRKLLITKDFLYYKNSVLIN